MLLFLIGNAIALLFNFKIHTFNSRLHIFNFKIYISFKFKKDAFKMNIYFETNIFEFKINISKLKINICLKLKC